MFLDTPAVDEYTSPAFLCRGFLFNPSALWYINTAMAEKDFLEMRGEVLESLPGGAFRIKLETDMEVIGHLAGKLRKNRIRVMPGDDVKCEISPYDLTKARITFRF